LNSTSFNVIQNQIYPDVFNFVGSVQISTA